MPHNVDFLPPCARVGLIRQRQAGCSSREITASADVTPGLGTLEAALCCFGEEDAAGIPFRLEPQLPRAVSGFAQL